MLENTPVQEQSINITTELVDCPLCSGRKLEKIKTFSKQSIIERWKEYYSIDIRPYFNFPEDFLTLKECQNCHLKTYSPHPLAAPAELYIALANRNPEAYFTPEKWEFNQALHDLGSCSNILEIGYGSGAFLRKATNEGLSIQGVELAPESTANATSKGLPILSESLEQLAAQQSEIFDGICSFQVLEHVASPASFIRQCYRLLKPSGLLALAVPNEASYLKEQDGLLNSPPHHLTRWSLGCFQWIAKELGFEVVRSAEEILPKGLSHDFLETWCQNRRWASRALPPSIRYQVGKFMGATGVHSLIKGQNLYVLLRKIAASIPS